MNWDGPLLMTKFEKRHLICVYVWDTEQLKCFFCFCFSVFGDRDGDYIVGIKREKVFGLMW